MSNEKVYIQVKKKAVISTDRKIKVEDIADVYSSRPEIMKKVEEVKVSNGGQEENWDSIGSVEIAGKVLDKYPDLDINLIGSDKVLVEYKSLEEENKFWEFIKVVSVCIILFFGATITIISFHEDVNTRASLEKLYFTFTGIKNDDPLIMAIPYSIGVGAGMITFFSRIFSLSKRRKKEPGPMEVELFVYDDEVEQYVSNEINKDKNVTNEINK